LQTLFLPKLLQKKEVFLNNSESQTANQNKQQLPCKHAVKLCLFQIIYSDKRKSTAFEQVTAAQAACISTFDGHVPHLYVEFSKHCSNPCRVSPWNCTFQMPHVETKESQAHFPKNKMND